MRRASRALGFSLALALAIAGSLPAVALAGPLPPPAVPVPAQHPSPPSSLTAPAWIVYDADSGAVLDGANIHERRAMASVTKIMTALVVRDQLDLDEQVRVSLLAADVGESEIGLVAGERWQVEDLLYGIMVRSGNDAAMALAETAGGSVSGFADLMNAKAAEMGLEDSHFTNPHGLDNADHYTSAYDLAVMGAEYMRDPTLARMSRTRQVMFKAAPSGAPRTFTNTNHLLGVYPGTAGIKTGYTGRAGLVLVSALQMPSRTVITVVMGSQEHFEDSKVLLDYGWRLVTLEDQARRSLLLEEGGGSQAGVELDDATRARLRATTDLEARPGRPLDFGSTATGQMVEERFRGMLPAFLGGTG